MHTTPRGDAAGHPTRELALTAAQREIWLAERLRPGTATNNQANYIDIRGPFDTARFGEALRRAIAETDAFRTRFVEIDGEPRQLVDADVPVPIRWADTSGRADPEAAALDVLRADLARPADLADGPLFRTVLVRLGPERHLWYQFVHHLTLDGFGAGLVLARVAAIYTALVDGTPVPEPAERPLADLLDDDAAYHASEQAGTDRAFWSDELADLDDPPHLGGMARAASPEFRRRVLVLDDRTSAGLRELARSTRQTLPAVLVAAASWLVHQRTGATDVPVGLHVTGRRGAVARSAPGMVANVVPVRTAPGTWTTAGDLVRGVSARMRAAVRHQRVGYEDLRRLRRNGSRLTRLSSINVNYITFEGDQRFGPAVGRCHNLSNGPVEDVALVIYDRGPGDPIEVDLNVNPQAHDESDVDRYRESVGALLDGLARCSPDDPMARIGVVGPDRRAQALRRGEGAPAGSATGVVRRVDDQVARCPDRPAVVDDATTLTYAELDARAERLVRALRGRGVRAGSRVGIALPRGADLVVAMLAVLRAGGVFVPFDPDWPAARTGVVAAVAEPVVTIGVLGGPDTVAVDADPPDTDATPVRDRSGAAGYVSFTSGSTGVPKGVLVRETALAAFLRHAHDAGWGPRDGDRLAAVTTVGFDIALLELLGPVVAGGTAIVLSATTVHDPWLLAGTARREGASVLQATPAVWEHLQRADPGLLDRVRVLVGGDVLTEPLAAALARAPAGAWNLYGPTEATVWTTAAALPRTPSGPPSLGEPFTGTRVLLLDHTLALVEPGALGEVYLGGIQLAEGYLGRPGETATRFVACPFTPGERLYRTGDLARWDPTSGLLFAGRVDHQVKVRGFRVEPGEVEAALLARPGVEQVVVVARGDRLVAYVCPPEAGEPEEIRLACRDVLPEHLVPSVVVVLDDLPQTPNRKIDRAALPDPATTDTTRAPGRQPSSDAERRVVAAVRELLDAPGAGPDDDLFRLGGHSLTAVRLVERLRAADGVELPVRDVFDHPRLADLAAALERRRAASPAVPAAEHDPADPVADEPSSGQQRAWLVNQLEECPTERRRAVLNTRRILHLDGPLDAGALRAALLDVITRHDVLRTVLPEHDGGPRPRVLPVDETRPWWDPEPRTVPALAGSAFTAAVDELAERPFDLRTEPPIRARLLVAPGQRSALVLIVHHGATDGWSWDVLVRDLGAAYRSRRAGAAPELPPVPVRYGEHATRQRRLLGSPDDPTSALAVGTAWWADRLDGVPDRIELPWAAPRPTQREHRAVSVHTTLPRSVSDRVRERAVASRSTSFMVVQALYAALLARLGSGVDLPIGTVVAGRGPAELDELVGFCVNTVVLRTDVAGDPSLTELVDRVRDGDLGAFEHADVPFEHLVDAVAPPRHLGHHPLVQVVLVGHTAGEAVPDLGPDVAVRLDRTAEPTTVWDLSLELADDGTDGIRLRLTAAADIASRADATAFLDRLAGLADAWTDAPDTPLSGIDVLSGRERDRVAELSRGPELGWGGTVVDELAARLDADPAAPALRDAAVVWSRADLDAASNRWCRWLTGRGIGRGDVVAVEMGRSVEVVVLMLAVAKAGAAYALVDVEYPAARRATMLSVARPALVLDAATVDEHRDRVAGLPADRIEPVTRPDDPAYVVFTSGSTGTPKGVVVTHRSLAQYVRWAVATYPGLAGDCLLHSALAFDLTVTVLWGPLAAGGRVHVAELDADLAVPDGGFTFVKGTTSHLPLVELVDDLFDAGGADLVLGGEQLHGEQLDTVRTRHPALRTWVEYGPTEITVAATVHPVAASEPVARGVVPVGAPLPDTTITLLDGWLRPVPPGAVGDLHVAGTGVALGYRDAAATTAVRFVPDPRTGERTYRTGDRARWDDAGRLEFLGRSDDQIKVRGFRVEPGDVEAVLAAAPGVRRAVVVLRDDRLVGYLEPTSPDPDLADAVAAHAAERLPVPMVPSAWVVVERFPLTTNRKVDRSALPDPQRAGDPAGAASSAAPSTEAERTVAAVVAGVLDRDAVGLDDDFFALGGNSLLAARLAGRLRSACGVELTVRGVFAGPTVRALAAFVTQAAPRPAGPGRDVPAPEPDEAPLSPSQLRLWLVNQAEELPDGRGLYLAPWVTGITGALDVPALRRAVTWLLERHEVLRTVYPEVGGAPVARVVDAARAAAELEWRHRRTDADGADELLTAALRRPMDVRTTVPVRVLLVELDERSWRLALVVHHVAVDGWSWRALADDLGTAYRAFAAGRAPHAVPPGPRYRDVAAWQHRTADRAAALARRRAALAGAPECLDLPGAPPRPPRRTHRSRVRPFTLRPETTERVRQLTRACGASPFMVVHALLAGFLTASGSGTDVPIGTAVAGRADDDLDRVVGFLVDTIVLRTDTGGAPTLDRLVARVRESDLDAYADQDVPFDDLVDALNPVRTPRWHPLVQVLLVQQSAPPDVDLGPGLDTTARVVSVPSTHVDVLVEFAETRDEDGRAVLTGTVALAADLYDDRAADALTRRWTSFVDAWVADPTRRLPAVPTDPSAPSPSAAPRTPVPATAAVPAPRTRSVADAAVLRITADVLGAVDLAPDDDFFAAGGNSLLAARLVGRVRDELGGRLTVRTVVEHPTVRGLTGALAGNGTGPGGSGRPGRSDANGSGGGPGANGTNGHGAAGDALAPVLRLRPVPRARRIVFCLPPAGGLGWPYRSLDAHLDPSVEIVALQSPRYREPGAVPGSVAELADFYADRIRSHRPDVGRDLLGWSFGGVLAHAVACRLTDPTARVIVLDGYPQHGEGGEPGTARQARELLLHHLGVAPEAAARAARSTAETARSLVGSSEVAAAIGEDEVAQFVENFVDTGSLAAQHVPGRFDGDLDLVVAEEHHDDHERIGRWSPLARSVAVHPVSGTHDELAGAAAMREIGPLVASVTAR